MNAVSLSVGAIVVAVLAIAAAVALAVLLQRARADNERLLTELDTVRTEVARLRTPRTPTARRANRAVRGVAQVVETAVEGAQRLREGGVTGLLMSSIDDLTTWAREDRTAISRLASRDGTITILFSDIEDSTRLNDDLGDKDFVRLLSAHNEIVEAAVEHHGGHIVKSQGDGFMIVFGSPADAVYAGIAMQDGLEGAGHRALRRTPIKVRVGIHCGEAIERDGDFFGRNVAMAARVASQANGGQILVSDDVRKRLREVEDVVLIEGLATELKGLPGTHRLWEVAVL